MINEIIFEHIEPGWFAKVGLKNNKWFLGTKWERSEEDAMQAEYFYKFTEYGIIDIKTKQKEA